MFDDERGLVGWVANRAHHADVGGAAPGSIPADATEIQQEGLRIPPTRYTEELRGLLLAASRTPDERAGDLDAQIGANVVGFERLVALGDAAVRRGGRLRRAPHAGGAGRAARRALAVRGRARLHRLGAPTSSARRGSW